MASPLGIRPVWHMMRCSRISVPKVHQNSRSFASETTPGKPSKEEIQKAREILERKGREYAEYEERTGKKLPDQRELEQAQQAFNDLINKNEEYLFKSRTVRDTPVFPAYTGAEQPLPETDESGQPLATNNRLPRAVQAIYLRPLRREATYGVPSCDLQLRSYSVRSLEFFADFALRAAYYLHLPAYGPVPLPRITQRWTVPKSSFIFKKSQENFERVTLRRLIQIKDGHPETVEIWLGFLRKYQHHGVGMKANFWEYDQLGPGKEMDATVESMKKKMKAPWANFGQKYNTQTAEKVVELMNSEKFRQAVGHASRT